MGRNRESFCISAKYLGYFLSRFEVLMTWLLKSDLYGYVENKIQKCGFACAVFRTSSSATGIGIEVLFLTWIIQVSLSQEIFGQPSCRQMFASLVLGYEFTFSLYFSIVPCFVWAASPVGMNSKLRMTEESWTVPGKTCSCGFEMHWRAQGLAKLKSELWPTAHHPFPWISTSKISWVA